LSDDSRTTEAGFDYHLARPADVGTLQSILSMRETPETKSGAGIAATRH